MSVNIEYVPDLLIEDVLSDILELIENPIGIVRSVDSSKSEEDLKKSLDFHKIDYEFVNDNFVLKRFALLDCINKNVFTGFDELWLFERKIPEYSFKNLPSSTSDGTFFFKDVNNDIVKSFIQSGAEIMLADGIGLNIMTSQKIYIDVIELWNNE